MECVGIEGILGFNIKFTVHSLRKHLKSLCILLFSAIAMQIYLMIDTLMLGFMSTYTEVGLYSSAIKSILDCDACNYSFERCLITQTFLFGGKWIKGKMLQLS